MMMAPGKFVPNENIQVANGGRDFWATSTTNTSVGTNYFSSAAFWKLREFAIAYQLPFKWIGEKTGHQTSCSEFRWKKSVDNSSRFKPMDRS